MSYAQGAMDVRTAALYKELQALEAASVRTTLRNPRGTSERSFKGPPLYDYAVASGLHPTDVSGAGMGNYYFVVEAEDGFRVALAYAEVSPAFTLKKVILAYEQDGDPLQVGVRLIVPGDDLGGRSITGVVSIELVQVEHAPPAAAAVGALEVAGLLERAGRLAPADLARFAATSVETLPTPRKDGGQTTPQAYRGVQLFTLLSDFGIRLDETIREDVLRKVIVARGADGYVAVVSAGEVEPRFMNGPAIVATARGDEALTQEEGAFRLIVPYDTSVGRAVKNLASLELREA